MPFGDNMCSSCSLFNHSLANSHSNASSHFLNHQQNQPLANLCGSKPNMKQSYSMYNFDAASFPEFNYIKQHMLQNDVSILAKSQSSLVESFLKNFEQGLTTLNQNIEKSKSMSQFDSFKITQSTNTTDRQKEEVIRTGYLTGKLVNSSSNKKEASENTLSSGKGSSSRLLSIDSLFSRRHAKSGVSKQTKATPVNISSKKVNRSEGSSLISWDLSSWYRDNQSTSYGDSSFNERSFVEPTSNKTSGNSFLKIYRNSQQSHSTGALVTATSCKKSLSNGSSSANSKQNSPSPTTSRMATSANGTEKKSHLFDFYSYYNNKYQENERKKSGRSISINNPNSVAHHFHRHRENGRPNPDGSKNYYITEASQFNMKKFASSL